MQQNGLAIIDDGGGNWGPMTEVRAVFDLRTGAWTAKQRIEHTFQRNADVLIVPKTLENIVKTEHPGTSVNTLPDQFEQFTVVLGRTADPAASVELSRAALQHCLTTGDFSAATPTGVSLLARPWDIFAHLDGTLRSDLDAIDLPAWDGRTDHVAIQGDKKAVKIAPYAKVHAMVVFNTELGPVVVDEGAIVGSFAVIAGPCYIGPRTIVAPHAHLRSFTSIGPDCVVAGEVSWSILHGRSNKSHAGYLGHSLVGQWVNLGADTNVSNLKNTYGSVRVQLSADAAPQDTGHIKLGPIIGDFVRTGIGSRLMTGSCIGTGSMVAVSGLAPKFVDRLRFVTDSGDERYDVKRFLATARTAMERRGCALHDAVAARLGALVDP